MPGPDSTCKREKKAARDVAEDRQVMKSLGEKQGGVSLLQEARYMESAFWFARGKANLDKGDAVNSYVKLVSQ